MDVCVHVYVCMCAYVNLCMYMHGSMHEVYINFFQYVYLTCDWARQVPRARGERVQWAKGLNLAGLLAQVDK